MGISIDYFFYFYKFQKLYYFNISKILMNLYLIKKFPFYLNFSGKYSKLIFSICKDLSFINQQFY